MAAVGFAGRASLSPRRVTAMERLQGFGLSRDNMPVYFVNPCPDRYKCIYCRSVARRLWKGPCQHGFCLSCLDRFSNTSLKCPVDGSMPDKRQLTEVAYDADEVLSMDVYCRYRQNGCQVTEQLKQLENHEMTCSWRPRDTPARLLPSAPSQGQGESCSGATRYACEFSELGCSFVGTEQETRAHVDSWKMHNSLLLTRYLEQKHQIEDLQAEKELVRNNVNEATVMQLASSEEISTLKQVVKDLQEYKEQLLQEIDVLRNEAQQQRSVLVDVCKEFKRIFETNGSTAKPGEVIAAVSASSDLPLQPKGPCLNYWMTNDVICTDGEFVWEVTDIRRRLDEADTGCHVSLKSPAFYMGAFGYRMIVQLHFLMEKNQQGQKVPTHLSVYWRLLAGEHDAALEWPFTQKVRLSAIDQSGSGCHRQFTVNPLRDGLTNRAFNKPLPNVRNASLGLNYFLSVDVLRDPNCVYIRDGTLVMKVDYEVSKLDEKLEELDGGNTLWVIRHYSWLKSAHAEAGDNYDSMLPRKVFCTSRYGYKIQAVLWPNGVGHHTGRQLTLGLCILPGSYDQLLHWPFRKKITVLVRDQTGGTNHKDVSINPDQASFQRDTGRRNSLHPINIISHSDLENSSNPYLRNDTIYLHIKVS